MGQRRCPRATAREFSMLKLNFVLLALFSTFLFAGCSGVGTGTSKTSVVPTATHVLPTARERMCSEGQRKYPDWGYWEISFRSSLPSDDIDLSDPTLVGRACRVGESINWLDTTSMTEIRRRFEGIANPMPTREEEHLFFRLWIHATFFEPNFVRDYCACEVAYLGDVERRK